MQRLALAVTSFVLLVCLTLAPAAADEITSKLEAYMQACVSVENFSGSVLVAKDGQTLLSKGYGLANIEHNVPNSPQTRFRLGSISKQFTAMAVMILQEQGKLHVDDPVKKHFPDAPAAWDEITIHHLLSHTAGLPNFTAFPEYARNMMLSSPAEQTIKRFIEKPLEFSPGAEYRYSNSGYVLLGAIIERAAGKPYASFLREAIFDPLEMRDSGYDTHAAILPHRAAGYQRSGEQLINAPYLDMTLPHAAGALYSTVLDLQRWDQALAEGTLISKESLQKMFTPVMGNYAYGWGISSRSGRKQISHGGGINGFSTYILREPEQKVLIVALCNVLPAAPARVANTLESIIFGESYSLPKARQVAKVDPKLYEAFVGKYQLAPTFIITITREEDRLMTQATGQPKFELFPESETKYFLKVVDAQVTFVRDDKEQVTSLILHQNGRDQTAKRVAEAEKSEK